MENLRKKVLVVSQELPYPLNTGGQVSIFNRLKGLSQDYLIDLCSVDLEELGEKKEVISNSLPFLRNFFFFTRDIPSVKKGGFGAWRYWFKNLLFEKFPRGASISRNNELSQFLRNNIKNYDLVLFENYNSFFHYCALDPIELGATRVALITHNLEMNLALQEFKLQKNLFLKAYYFIEYLKIRNYEKLVYSLSPIILCISRSDYNLLRHQYPNVEYLSQHLNKLGVSWKFNNSKKVIFNSNLKFAPNLDGLLWYLKHVHPILQIKEKEYQLVVTGSIENSLKKQLEIFGNITLTGFLQADEFEKEFLHADVMVNPVSKGSGVKIKILDSLSVGIPIVSTSHSAEGIDSLFRIAIADEPQAFATKILEGLANQLPMIRLNVEEYNQNLNKVLNNII